MGTVSQIKKIKKGVICDQFIHLVVVIAARSEMRRFPSFFFFQLVS